MKQKLLLFLLVFITSITVLKAQILFEENFESHTLGTGIVGQDLDFVAIGGYPLGVPFSIDASKVNFSDSSNDYIRIDVSAEELQFQDLEGISSVTFDAIDISSQTGDVTINIGKIDFNIDSSCNCSWGTEDFIDISYSLDGGTTFVRVPNHMGNGNVDHTFVPGFTQNTDYDFNLSEVIDPGTAGTLILRLSGFNDSGDEEFEFDDIDIIRNTISVYSEDFSGYDGINGVEFAGDDIGVNGSGIFAATDSGDYPSVSWTLTLSDDEQLENSGDYVKVVNEDGNKVLEYNDLGDNQPVTFDTNTINITGQSDITFGLDINFRETTYESEDFVDVFYSLDGGTTFTLAEDDGNGHTYSGSTITSFGTNEDQKFVKTLSGLTSTNFILRIVTSNDSGNEDYQLDNIKVVSGTTLSTKENTLTGVTIYPIPTKDDGLLNIKSPYVGNTYISLYDISGREVYKTILPSNNVINISNIKSGFYSLIVSQDNKSIIKKIVK